MAGLVDGLGCEEIGQAGSQPSQIWVTGSVVSESVVKGAQIVSNGSVVDELGRLRNTVLSHAGSTYGAFVQAGSVVTDAASGGTIEFAHNFADVNYIVTLTPQNYTAGAGAAVPYVSGTRNVSGCEIVGAASTVYDYIAVGT